MSRMTAYDMDQREIDIAEAGRRVVLRYGMSRTTMSDVAQEAGISRQTLYAVFSSKDELLRAIIRQLSNRKVAGIEADFERTSDLGERLDSVILHMAIKSFELLQASPDAEDIVTGFNAACKEELKSNAVRYHDLLTDMLKPYQRSINSAGMTVPALADFIQKSTLMIKHEASDMAHITELAGSLKALVLHVALAGSGK
ncbi:MAG: hypothetical protein CMQ46_03350 [Gammaproteobacteria bacterium]|nr:hypothetical protein [Gammaproteobacteria bacterium]MBJ54284.1 hypothetical protein [Gammaproteobacteria bacterium]